MNMRFVKALKQSPLFHRVEEPLLKEMLGVLQYGTYEKGRVIACSQQDTDRIYIIVSGRAKASIYNLDNGREHILFLLQPGDVFDVIHFLDGNWQSATITALDNMEVLSTTISYARTWLDLHPDFNKSFLPYLGEKLRILANQVTSNALYDTETRLARLIVDNLSSDPADHKTLLINDLSQESIASMIGTVRVIVARHLQDWKKRNILVKKGGDWSLQDLKALLTKARR